MQATAHHMDPTPTLSEFGRPLARLQRPRMLVVEDDRDLWTAIDRIARQVNSEIEIDWASDADRASEKMTSERYDIVLADFLLEGSATGYALRSRCDQLQPWATFGLMSSMPLRTSDRDGCPFMLKPFTVSGCRDFLEDLLEA